MIHAEPEVFDGAGDEAGGCDVFGGAEMCGVLGSANRDSPIKGPLHPGHTPGRNLSSARNYGDHRILRSQILSALFQVEVSLRPRLGSELLTSVVLHALRQCRSNLIPKRDPPRKAHIALWLDRLRIPIILGDALRLSSFFYRVHSTPDSTPEHLILSLSFKPCAARFPTCLLWHNCIFSWDVSRTMNSARVREGHLDSRASSYYAFPAVLRTGRQLTADSVGQKLSLLNTVSLRHPTLPPIISYHISLWPGYP
ncbi:hypothetical protein K438DRAFT_176111 [Mycena galopus ATCC 62051]|nr:hypothetical protein K438DRAFT_176111 [Mycena galopus ATCC 62051]